MCQNSLHKLSVDRQQLLSVRVVHVADSYVSCESGRDFVATKRSGWVHRSDDCHTFQTDKIQIVIVESFVANQLLEETYQLNCVVLIRFRQVDIFEVNDESLDFFRPVNSTVGVSGLRAHLVQLLDYVEG